MSANGHTTSPNIAAATATDVTATSEYRRGERITGRTG